MFDLLLIMINDMTLLTNMTFNEELAVRGNTMFWSAAIPIIILVLTIICLFFYRKSKS